MFREDDFPRIQQFVFDQLFHPDGAMVIPKDPLEYFTILKWHQENTVFNA